MRKQYKQRKAQQYRVPNTNHDYRRAVTGMKSPILTRTEKAVLTAIVHRNDADGYCFPSERDIAETAPAHVRTVQRIVPKLIRLKLVRKTSRTKTGKRNGSCGYAATVSIGEPTRHHVEGTRHLAVPEHGTVSGLNKPFDQTIEQLGDPIRLVGDKLLERGAVSGESRHGFANSVIQAG